MESPAGSTTSPMYCLKCDYSLDHLTTQRCPECGREFDPADPKSFAQPHAPRWPHVVVLAGGFLVGLIPMSLEWVTANIWYLPFLDIARTPALLAGDTLQDWVDPALAIACWGSNGAAYALTAWLWYLPGGRRWWRRAMLAAFLLGLLVVVLHLLLHHIKLFAVAAMPAVIIDLALWRTLGDFTSAVALLVNGLVYLLPVALLARAIQRQQQRGDRRMAPWWAVSLAAAAIGLLGMSLFVALGDVMNAPLGAAILFYPGLLTAWKTGSLGGILVVNALAYGLIGLLFHNVTGRERLQRWRSPTWLAVFVGGWMCGIILALTLDPPFERALLPRFQISFFTHLPSYIAAEFFISGIGGSLLALLLYDLFWPENRIP